MNSSNAHSIDAPGSLSGSIMMVAGCCIGAGMIGLPVITAISGFLPTILALAFSWVFMVSTGFLLLEANLWFKKNGDLLSMSKELLGKKGKMVCGATFLFLFFSLVVAYLSGTGLLISDVLSSVIGGSVPSYLGTLFCAGFLFWVLFRGTYAVDLLNRVCVIGMILTYLCVTFLGIFHIRPEYLSQGYFDKGLLMSIPVLIISFGFQNLVPSLTSYLKRDLKKLKLVILIGCSIPFFVYVIWEMVILGIVSPSERAFFSTKQDTFVIHMLSRTVNSSYLSIFIQMFSFFALLTSLITVALSCVDFLSSTITFENPKINRIVRCALVIFPPLVFSLNNPNLFLWGLGVAGGFGAVILFGILPVMMVWVGRYKRKISDDHLLPGGKFTLSLLACSSLLIFGAEFLKQISAF